MRLADYDLERQEVTANVGGEEARYQLGMSGRHMAVNSLAVIAALSAMDLDWRKAVAEFANASQPKGRGQRHTVIINGKRVLLIDDTYNANPASMAAAIELLAQLTPPPGGRRIAVLADMLELGVAAARYHAELAEAIVKAGIEKAGKADDTAAVAAALKSGEPIATAIGNLTYGESGDLTSPSFSLFKWEGGKIVAAE